VAGALAMLEAYDWPGNVRELANTIERAVILAEGEDVEESHLPDAVRAFASARRRGRIRRTLAELEADYIAETLEAVRGNKSEAARILGISRKNLYERLARYSRQEDAGGRDEAEGG